MEGYIRAGDAEKFTSALISLVGVDHSHELLLKSLVLLEENKEKERHREKEREKEKEQEKEQEKKPEALIYNRHEKDRRVAPAVTATYPPFHCSSLSLLLPRFVFD
jgi:hypothetical protein